jgi:hypothetical protein
MTVPNTANPEPVDQAAPPVDAGTQNQTQKPPEAKEPEGSGEDDWFSKLPEHAQKEIKKTRSDAQKAKDKLTELSSKLSDKEKAEQEHQRKQDEENGNFKNIAKSEKAQREALEQKITLKNERIMKAELRNAAIKEGIIEPSDVDLFGVEGLSIDENDDVVGVEKRIKELKKSKPHFFKAADAKAPEGTTSERQPPAAQTNARTKNAMDMTPEEFREAEKKLISESKSRVW